VAGAVTDKTARAFFAEHGWLLVRRAVDPARLAGIGEIYAEVTANLPLAGTALWQVSGAKPAHAAVVALLRDSGLAALAAKLLDVESVELLQDAFILKCRGPEGRIAPHQDYSYTGWVRRGTLSLRVPLVPETPVIGCMWVVDGSHRWGLVGGIHQPGGSLRDVREVLTAEQRAQLDSRRVMLEMTPGDVSLHHCLTLHGSDENRSASPRRTVVAHVVGRRRSRPRASEHAGQQAAAAR
jgi:ectoine hydroxylase-related dioxygenase (phytanoyl-CoA dioxygenase family)